MESLNGDTVVRWLLMFRLLFGILTILSAT